MSTYKLLIVITKCARSPLWKNTKVFPLTITPELTQVDRKNEIYGEKKENLLSERDIVVVEHYLHQTVTQVCDHDQTKKNVEVLGVAEVKPVVFSRNVERIVDEHQRLPGVGDESDDNHHQSEHFFPCRLVVFVPAFAAPDDLFRAPRK